MVINVAGAAIVIVPAALFVNPPLKIIVAPLAIVIAPPEFIVTASVLMVPNVFAPLLFKVKIPVTDVVPPTVNVQASVAPVVRVVPEARLRLPPILIALLVVQVVVLLVVILTLPVIAVGAQVLAPLVARVRFT